MPARPISITCAAGISITAPTSRRFGTTYRSICRPTPMARATPISTGSFPKPSADWISARGRIGPTWETSRTPATCTSRWWTAFRRTSSRSPSAASTTRDISTLGSVKAGGGNLLYAGEFTGYDGPWTNPDDMKKFSGLLRYSQGTATDGFSLTGMAYTNTWNSTDQNALRAYTTGQIGLYGDIRSDRWRRHQPLLAVRAEWRRPPTTDRGKPMPILSNTRWTCGTTTLMTPPIRSTAISSISATIASTAAAAPRAPSTEHSAVCRPRR